MPCVFTLTRGARRGQPCNGSSGVGQFCTRHYNMMRRREQQYQRQRQPTDYNPIIRRDINDDINNILQQFDRIQIEPEEEKEVIYESCSMCHNKVEGAKVTLDCGCEYHLNCYLIVQNETHCLKCNDKINKTEEDYPECSICLEIIKKNGNKTKCGHHFHKKCIKKWRRIKHNCPNCRAHL